MTTATPTADLLGLNGFEETNNTGENPNHSPELFFETEDDFFPAAEAPSDVVPEPQMVIAPESENVLPIEQNTHEEPQEMSQGATQNPSLKVLDEELAKLALDELNEDPTTRPQKLEELRYLVTNDTDLHCPADDSFLIKFLRHRKFNMTNAHSKVRSYYSTRKSNPDVFGDYRPSSVQSVMQNGVISVLPHPDKFSRRVVVYRPGIWDYHTCSREDLLKASALMLERLLMDEEVQIRGITVIIDLAHLSLKRAMKLGPGFVKKFNAVTQKAVPMRVKNIQILRGSHVFNVLYKMCSVLMTDKMKSRVQNCGSEARKLIQNICDNQPGAAGASILPIGPEYQGTGDVTLPSTQFYEELLTWEKVYEQMSQYHIKDTSGKKR